MSVVAHSPFADRKRRGFEDNDFSDSFDRHTLSVGKRPRLHSGAVGRCVQFSEGAYAVSPSTLAALQSLFPDMDAQTVTDVLSECGNNIDAAIKRLGELRLSAEESAAVEAAAAATAAPSDSGRQQAAPSATTSSAPAGPQSAEHWVEYLVQEMATARDMQDAKGKAAGILQQFEMFVNTILKNEGKLQGSDVLQAKLAEVQKENHILKRAVQIQNTKLQEKAQQDLEVQQLKQLLSQYQEQVKTLEINNYSLALHLSKATSTGMMSGSRNPDVF